MVMPSRRLAKSGLVQILPIPLPVVDLTYQNTNRPLLVEGPTIDA
jgi:hypothetical protein